MLRLIGVLGFEVNGFSWIQTNMGAPSFYCKISICEKVIQTSGTIFTGMEVQNFMYIPLMNRAFSGFRLFLFIIFLSCDSDKSKSLFSGDTDSCAIALKAEGPMAAQSMVSNNFSGVLTNYWGDDTSKIDFTHVFENGRIIESTFFYENGKVQEKYHYKCGALHGEQRYYYKNGQLAKTIPFSYGYKQGRGEFYNEAGKLLESVVFERDSIVKKSDM